MALLVAAAGVGIFFAASYLASGTNAASIDVPTAPARIMTLRDKVVEEGEVESQSTITGTCEIDDHENKIIFLAPEGTQVKKGEVVCKFDSSKFENYVTERETMVAEQKAEVDTAEQELKVQQDENESALRAAKQAVEFTRLDLDKYMKGDYEVKKSDLQGAISEAKTNVEKARRSLENMRTLVKRGFREYEQLRQAEQVLESAELRLTRDQQKLDTLENFEHVKSEAEFKGKYEEAQHKLEIAKTTAAAKLAKAQDRLKNEETSLKIHERRLKDLQKNLDKHRMKAPQDGTFVYARDNWRGNGEKLHEGKMVYQNQPIFVLPDMERMQVKVGVHESLVGKIKPGQPAIIRVDAFSTISLQGKVKTVALLSDSTRWEPSNNYSVIVTINEFPDDMKLKPGMSAKVEILVGVYEDVVAVPIQAVASFGKKKYAFVQNSNGAFESREVTVDRSNISFVEITEGLEEEEVVALDAYQRALTEFGDEEPEQEDETENLVPATEEELVAASQVKESEGEDSKGEESEVGMTSEETSETDLPPRPAGPEGDAESDSESDDDESKKDASNEEESNEEDSNGDEPNDGEIGEGESNEAEPEPIEATSEVPGQLAPVRLAPQ